MENKKICSICKGNCCNAMGCHYSPDDFKDLTFDGLVKEIEKGHISIDWWEGKPFCDGRNIREAYYLRIRNINSPIVDPSWGGRCSLLTNTGCPLSYEKRPKGGRAVIPRDDFMCTTTYDKEQCAKEWYKHHDILDKLFKKFA